MNLQGVLITDATVFNVVAVWPARFETYDEKTFRHTNTLDPDRALVMFRIPDGGPEHTKSFYNLVNKKPKLVIQSQGIILFQGDYEALRIADSHEPRVDLIFKCEDET